MKRIWSFLLAMLMCSAMLMAQDDKCYSERVGKADAAFAKKEWKKARDYYSRAKDCVQQDSNREYVEQQIALCNEKLGGAPASTVVFAVSPTSYTFGENGGSQRFSIDMQGVKTWEVANADQLPSWMTVTTQDRALEVKCERNLAMVDLSFTIELRTISRTATYRKTATLEIKQKAASPRFELSHSYWTPQYSGGSMAVTVRTNLKEVYNVNSSASWLQATSQGYNISLSCQENKKHEPRQATVTITCGQFTRTLVVTQDERPSSFLLDQVGLQLGCGLEAEVAFRLKNGHHIRFTAGMWDMWAPGNVSGGVSASYIWNYDFNNVWRLNYGVGLGVGGVRRGTQGNYYSRGAMAVLPTIGVEMMPTSWTTNGLQWGLTLEYRPYLGTDFSGFYHCAYNFNIGARIHLH